MISWLSSGGGWGTREQAIPGEWAALVLVMVLGALLGMLVLWFTVLRHERTIRRRAARRPNDTSDTNDVVALAGIGAAADERATTGLESESAIEAAHEVGEEVEEPAADEDDGESGEATAEPPATSSSQPGVGSAKRKLTDEILSRVETELAARETPRWKELAELVRQEFGVTVHPSSIQKAVKRRRLAADQGVAAVTSAPDVPDTTEPAAEPQPAPPETRPESTADVRPNGGRRSTAWASPAYPAADAG